MTRPEDVSRNARALHGAVEPIAAHVYFAPEVHDAFAAIGFGPGDRGDGGNHLHLPDLAAYFCSRAGCMGQVPGEVVVSVFGVFDPAVIVPETGRGWATASHADIMAARERGVTAALERVLGPLGTDPARATELMLRAADAGWAAGRPLFAGLRSMPLPREPWAAMWRAADVLREHRGDAHIAAWTAAGLDPVEAGLLTEVYADMPRRRYHLTRGWPERTIEEGLDRLRAKGLLQGDPVTFTDAGAALRESVEVATDAAQEPFLHALGDDLEELLGHLRPWSAALVDARCYPSSIEQLPPSWGRPPTGRAG